jgi:hypothetical protein
LNADVFSKTNSKFQNKSLLTRKNKNFVFSQKPFLKDGDPGFNIFRRKQNMKSNKIKTKRIEFTEKWNKGFYFIRK